MAFIVATIQSQAHSIEINADEINTDEPSVQVTLDGRGHTIDWKQIAPLARDEKKQGDPGAHYSLLLGGRSYDVFARRITRPEEKNAQTYEIFIDGQRFEVAAEDERTRVLAGLIAGTVRSGEVTIYAPMPGLVVGVLLEVGAEVKAGQPVIVLEAMKMENDLTAPLQGRIKKIAVQKGQTVDQGAALVVIDGNTEG
jgi:biotin carboxyl carrier protein